MFANREIGSFGFSMIRVIIPCSSVTIGASQREAFMTSLRGWAGVGAAPPPPPNPP